MHVYMYMYLLFKLYISDAFSSWADLRIISLFFWFRVMASYGEMIGSKKRKQNMKKKKKQTKVIQ